MYGNNAGEMVRYLVHAHLKDVLGPLQTKGHAQEPVPAILGTECGQVGRLLIEMYAPGTVVCIQLTEADGTA